MARPAVSRRRAIAYRLAVNHLDRRLPAGAYDVAARCALQDTIPRSALVSLHARVDGCEPDAWADRRLIQTYSPRAAVHVFPVVDRAVFTVGRLPIDPEARRRLERDADRACRALAGGERRANELPEDLDLRGACATGRIAIRWDARLTWIREVPRPDVDLDEARSELGRRHIRAFGPTTPEAYAWWAGLSPVDARQVWAALTPELVEVDLDGHRAWILAADEDAIRSARSPRGVRLLPAEEGKLFGADSLGLFAGPSRRVGSAYVSHHPHIVLVDGKPAGVWGRRGGRVSIRLDRPAFDDLRERIEAEALALPIPNAKPSVRFA